MIAHIIITGTLADIEYDDEFDLGFDFDHWEPASIPEGKAEPGDIVRIVVVDCGSSDIAYDSYNVQGFV